MQEEDDGIFSAINESIKIAEEDIKETMKENRPINDYILLILLVKRKLKNEVEKLQDYDDIGLNGVLVRKLEILPPADSSHYLHEIREAAKRDTPTAVVSVELIRTDHKEEMEDLYEQFLTGQIKNSTDNIELIIRVESYKKTIRKYYKIENNNLNLIEELASDGKKFLPFLN